MIRALLLALAVAMVPFTAGAKVPPRALELLPVVVDVQRAIWPDAPIPSFIGAQIEQETCYSPTHRLCWNPRAELKTSREYGFGLGQITRAYRADGSVRFDKFSELKQQYPSLRGWQWANRYDAKYQITAIVEMDRGIYRRIAGAASDFERLAFTLAAYNGGESGVRQDRLMCRKVKGCDSTRWFGHVEKHSMKSRKPWQGYGQSAFDINRGYVRNVIHLRRVKYEPFFKQAGQ